MESTSGGGGQVKERNVLVGSDRGRGGEACYLKMAGKGSFAITMTLPAEVRDSADRQLVAERRQSPLNTCGEQ